MELLRLIEWQNLPFVLPFIAGMGYVLLLATGAVSAGHDTDMDVDHNVDVDVHADADLDHDTDLGAEHDTGVHHDTDHTAGVLTKLLSLVGVGKTPLSIVFTSFCFVWGFTGYVANLVLEPILRFPQIYFWLSFASAVIISLFCTSFIARIVGRIMPSTESYGISQESLVGSSGTAVLGISDQFGRVQVRDENGDLHEISCFTESGNEVIPKGTEVMVIRRDNTRDMYVVCPIEDRKENQ